VATRHTTRPSRCWKRGASTLALSRLPLASPAPAWHAHGLQRYRCVPCGRTFNALTGTPLARLRHKALWIEYADCLLDSASVRQAAQQLGVHRNTTFRWRHRFLTVAKTDRPHGLHGIAEADELYLLESEREPGE